MRAGLSTVRKPGTISASANTFWSSPRPDEDLARSWTSQGKCESFVRPVELRRRRVRLLEYLKAIYPNRPTASNSRTLPGSPSQCAQCLEELSEDGWLIVSSPPDGSPTSSGCRLASLDRQP